MAPHQVLCLARVFQLLCRILAHGLEHGEARLSDGVLASVDEALVHQGMQRVEVGVRDRFCPLERAAAGEDGDAAEEALFLGREQVVAPVNRRPQRLLARLCVSSPLEQVESLGEPLEDLRRR